MNKHLSVVTAVGGVLAGVLVGLAASQPSTSAASPPQSRTASASSGHCPAHALPLRAEGVARAADQARIEAPALYKGFGPAVVELAWQAKFRLHVWAGTPFHCSEQLRHRPVVVDLLFPKMLPSASLSKGVVLVSRFPTGYRVWRVAH